LTVGVPALTLAESPEVCMRRTRRLTEELVRLATREVADAGPMPGFEHFSEADYDEHLNAFLRDRPEGELHVFAYGSLIWKPVYQPAAAQRATAPGWHRAFCLKVARFRGTIDRPGLMMQLHPGGGPAEGVLHRLDRTREIADLRTLWRREITVKPPGNVPRWIETVVDGTMVPAIAFTANLESRNYVGGLSIDETAAMIARACGHWGSCAEYLQQTITALEASGIDDPYLWELEDKVADHLQRLGG
jgi:cation transport protein ChaC